MYSISSRQRLHVSLFSFVYSAIPLMDVVPEEIASRIAMQLSLFLSSRTMLLASSLRNALRPR